MTAVRHVNKQRWTISDPLTWRMDRELRFSDWKIEIFVSPSVLHGSYHVHRAVLAVGPRRSEYFERLFRSTGFVESKEKTSRIEMVEAAANAFPLVLDYLYSSSDQNRIEYKDSAALYHLGEYFGIHSLCLIAVARWVKPARIPLHCLVALYEQATIFGIDKLRKAILQACCGTDCIEEGSYPIRDDARFWLGVIETNGGTPNEHLCTLVADYCTSKGGDVEVYKRLRRDEGHFGVLSDDKTLWKLLELEQSVSPRDDTESSVFTNIQNKCIELLASSWQQPDPIILQYFRAKLDPRVLSAIFSKVKAYRVPIRVVVSGAGCSAVNGIYIRCQSTDDFAPKYLMENGRWCGEDAVFSIEAFLMQSNSWAWCISIVDDEQPGTERDIDFYTTVPRSQRLRRPPVSGWHLLGWEGFGVDPVPSIELVFDEEMDVDN